MSPDFSEILQRQRQYFNSGVTRPIRARQENLSTLYKLISENRNKLQRALHDDLGKPDVEAYLGEIGFVLKEIQFALKNVSMWARQKRVRTPWLQWFGSSHIYSEPVGVVLIIGAWNYPVQLVIAPLVGALAAGNCAIVKPSELAPQTSSLIGELIRNGFGEENVTCVEGNSETATGLLQHPFDHIFFTGSMQIGRIVLTAAAKHLTPVTLELGGKNPCIVDLGTNLKSVATRIAWGKFFNAGQTCVAPDYVLVHESGHDELIQYLKEALEKFYGPDPEKSPDYARIINERHFTRLSALINGSKPCIGGTLSKESRYIAPTVLTDLDSNHPVMKEEIFGPILPVFRYRSVQEAIQFVNARLRPLTLYLFSKNRAIQKRIVDEVPFGGGCINDCLTHFSNPHLPFGGVGPSGIGAYHGRFSFDVFSHRKGVLKRSFWIDPGIRYPPYQSRLSLFTKLYESFPG